MYANIVITQHIVGVCSFIAIILYYRYFDLWLLFLQIFQRQIKLNTNTGTKDSKTFEYYNYINMRIKSTKFEIIKLV